MARFTTALSHTFLRSRARPADVVPEMLLPVVEPALDDAEDRQRGPGWFDSSWDLQRGLEVREGLPGDPQLDEWIEACLRSGPVIDVQSVRMAPTASTLLSTLPPPRALSTADRPCDWVLV